MTTRTRETMTLLKMVMKLRKPGERLQGWVWAPQKELLPDPQHTTGTALLALHGLGFLFQRSSSGLCTPLSTWLVQLTPNFFELPDPDAADVGPHVFIHPPPWASPEDAMGSPPAAPCPGGHRHPGAHLRGVKNNVSEGKAWRKVLPPCWFTAVREKNGIPRLCTTSAPAQSQLTLTPAAAFPLWEDAHSLWHEGTSLHQRSDSKRSLLREPGCGAQESPDILFALHCEGSSLLQGSPVS